MVNGTGNERRGGSALADLVVVIVVVGVFAAMLLPILATGGEAGPGILSAREKSRRAKCLNNLKQIALASRQYAGDFNEYPRGEKMDAETHWTQLGRLHATYVSTMKVFFCPSCRDKEWSWREDVPEGEEGSIFEPFPGKEIISYAYAMDGSDEKELRPLRESMPWTVKVAADKPCAVKAEKDGDKRGNHLDEGRNVAFLDGSGRWISGPDPLDVDDEDKADQTGERWWSDPPITKPEEKSGKSEK